MKILIADDSTLIRQSLKKLLFALNGSFQFYEAKNIKQTIELFSRQNPDLIILDLRLPDGNGIDALKTIKKQRPEQKVMIFSNYPDALNRQKCKAAGADYFFDKSSDFEKLYAEINTLRGCYKKQDGREDQNNQ